MFVNKHPFINTISKHIKSSTTDKIPSTKINTLFKSLKQVLYIYKIRGFKVKHIKMDWQFELMKAKVATLGFYSNTVAANKHFPMIEQCNCTIK